MAMLYTYITNVAFWFKKGLVGNQTCMSRYYPLNTRDFTDFAMFLSTGR